MTRCLVGVLSNLRDMRTGVKSRDMRQLSLFSSPCQDSPNDIIHDNLEPSVNYQKMVGCSWVFEDAENSWTSYCNSLDADDHTRFDHHFLCPLMSHASCHIQHSRNDKLPAQTSLVRSHLVIRQGFLEFIFRCDKGTSTAIICRNRHTRCIHTYYWRGLRRCGCYSADEFWLSWSRNLPSACRLLAKAREYKHALRSHHYCNSVWCRTSHIDREHSSDLSFRGQQLADLEAEALCTGQVCA